MERCCKCETKCNGNYEQTELEKEQKSTTLCKKCMNARRELGDVAKNGEMSADKVMEIDSDSELELVAEMPKTLVAKKALNQTYPPCGKRNSAKMQVSKTIDLTYDSDNESLEPAAATNASEMDAISTQPDDDIVEDMEYFMPSTNTAPAAAAVAQTIAALPKMPTKQPTISCKQCKSKFANAVNYIKHLRTRHRTSTESSVLREKPFNSRSGDSGLTIRLLYMSKSLYFECNICGEIDGAKQTHRSHLREFHIDELLSLDEIKQCGVCKLDIENGDFDLFQHLVMKHKGSNHRFLIQQANVGNDVKAGNVYKLNKCDKLFYECQLCGHCSEMAKVHMKHVSEKHYIPEETKPKSMLGHDIQLRMRRNTICYNFSGRTKLKAETIAAVAAALTAPTQVKAAENENGKITVDNNATASEIAAKSRNEVKAVNIAAAQNAAHGTVSDITAESRNGVKAVAAAHNAEHAAAAAAHNAEHAAATKTAANSRKGVKAETVPAAAAHNAAHGTVSEITAESRNGVKAVAAAHNAEHAAATKTPANSRKGVKAETVAAAAAQNAAHGTVRQIPAKSRKGVKAETVAAAAHNAEHAAAIEIPAKSRRRLKAETVAAATRANGKRMSDKAKANQHSTKRLKHDDSAVTASQIPAKSRNGIKAETVAATTKANGKRMADNATASENPAKRQKLNDSGKENKKTKTKNAAKEMQNKNAKAFKMQQQQQPAVPPGKTRRVARKPRVKVKGLIQSKPMSEALRFACQYCGSDFLGFIRLNWHILDHHWDKYVVAPQSQPRKCRRKLCAPKRLNLDENSNLHDSIAAAINDNSRTQQA